MRILEFKDVIKGLRINSEITTSQLAAAMGKSEGAIRSWETGRAKPDADTLIKLSEYFQCSVDYLLGLSYIKYHSIRDQLQCQISEIRAYQRTAEREARKIELEILRTKETLEVLEEELETKRKEHERDDELIQILIDSLESMPENDQTKERPTNGDDNEAQ